MPDRLCVFWTLAPNPPRQGPVGQLSATIADAPGDYRAPSRRDGIGHYGAAGALAIDGQAATQANGRICLSPGGMLPPFQRNDVATPLAPRLQR